MADYPVSRQRVFLSILPARSNERLVALCVAVTGVLVFAAFLPFAKIPLTRIDAFIPVYESALVISDVITAVLLLGQFSNLPSRGLLSLACGYVYSSLLIIAHMLSYPGVFSPTGWLGAGPQTTAWLYMAWHAGFPFFISLYALQQQPGSGGDTLASPRRAMMLSIAAVAVLALALVLVTTWGQSLLPAIMIGNHYSPLLKGVVTGVWLVSVIAIFLLWRRKPHSVLDLWLMVVLGAWLGDIGLSAMLNAARFDLGFYAGRIFGFGATSFVLIVLLLETRALYARLARTLATEGNVLRRTIQALRDSEDRLKQLNETLELRVEERSRQLEAEIIERERAQDTAREAQKMEAIGRMAGGIAHDFNNLLTVILGNAEILQSPGRAEQDRSAIESIEQAAERGARLVRQILTFSRRQPVKPEVVDLRRRVIEINEMLDRSVRGDVRLITTLADDLWPFHCDLGELEIALMNLCGNARDALPKGGLVRLDGRNRSFDTETPGPNGLIGDFTALAIMDSGVGIAPENLRQVFEPFFTTKEVGKGTGLGLSQVYGFAQQAGGSVAIESMLGRGTTVTIYLPRATAVMLGATEAAQPLPGRGSAKGVVLLVEDDEPVAMVAKRMLEIIGYRVEHLRDAGTALAVLLSGQLFDVVFSDIIMPGGMSGLELARSIRQRFPRLPILLTSGYARATGDVHQEGFNIIAKPFDTDSLAAALRRAVAEMGEVAANERDLA